MSSTKLSAWQSFVRVRPFSEKEANTTPPESKVPRPALDVDPAQMKTIVALDPANKFKPKKGGSYTLEKDVLWSFVDTIDAPAPMPMPDPVGQNTVYEKVVQPLLPTIGEGYSTAFLVVGPAGSGKTHALYGPDDEGDEHAFGWFGRFSTDFFKTLQQVKRENSTQLVEVEVTDINNENFTDLLAKKSNIMSPTDRRQSVVDEIKVMQSAEEGTYLSNSTRVSVSNDVELQTTVQLALKTQKKRKSSHLITLRICETYEFADPDADPNDPNAKPIQKSRRFSVIFGMLRTLSPAFKRCVDMCVERDNGKPSTKIPSRDTNTTKVLQDVFAGTINVALLTTVSPYYEHVKDSQPALDLAVKFGKVKCDPKFNHDADMLELRTLSDQVKDLRAETIKENKNMAIVQSELDRRQELLNDATERNNRHTAEYNEVDSVRRKNRTVQAVAQMMVDKVNAEKKKNCGELEKKIATANAGTVKAGADRKKAMEGQNAALQAKEKIEEETESVHKANEPIQEEHKEWKGFEQEVTDMERLVNSSPDEKRKIVEERQGELNVLRKEEAQLKEEQAQLNEKSQGFKTRHFDVKPTYDEKFPAYDKYKKKTDEVEAQKKTQAELEKEVKELEEELEKIEAEIKQLPGGCCSVM